MIKTTKDVPPADLATDYLRRLDTAARVLPDTQRAELVDGIAGHIAEAQDSGAVTDEAGLRALLDRLGDPSDIVASAGGPPTPWPNQVRPESMARELTAVLLMTVGSIIPFIGWLAGVVLMWTSAKWKTWEKVIGTLVFPGGTGLVLFAGSALSVSSTESCSGSAGAAMICTHSHTGPPPWLSATGVLTWIVLSIAVPIWLYVRAERRNKLIVAGHADGRGGTTYSTVFLVVGVVAAVLVVGLVGVFLAV